MTDAIATRFAALTEQERDTIHWALTTAAARVLEDAGNDRLGDDPEILSQAGGVFALASSMARELDLAAGRPNAQDTDSITMAAACIAEHQAPGAMRDAAEGPDCGRDVNACAEECEQDGCQGRPA